MKLQTLCSWKTKKILQILSAKKFPSMLDINFHVIKLCLQVTDGAKPNNCTILCVLVTSVLIDKFFILPLGQHLADITTRTTMYRLLINEQTSVPDDDLSNHYTV